jgi:crotonobetainyl-CoA:carnitine CoA-transferase CaiB-like acyl-CoA transferase
MAASSMAHLLVPAQAALRDLWHAAGLDAPALDRVSLSGAEPVLPSSFAVGTAAQVSIAAAALAAAELGRLRNGVQQRVAVDMRHAALECCTHFRIDGRVPEVWDKLSGLYPCGDDGRAGWVRIHANFAHHRDGALRLLGLPPGEATERADVTRALRDRHPVEFEQAAADAGMVVAALRSFDQWDAHPQGVAVAHGPLIHIEKIGEASPVALPPLSHASRPLQGLRVLDLTRILAGPVGGRALAAYGADVMLVNSPHLPNIEAIADTSRGKLSAHADLRSSADRAAFERVLREAHVVLQGYRPGGLASLGYGPGELAALRPGVVVVSLSAYGPTGPWAGRRGFDSLVQTATGFNDAEAQAFGGGPPRALPMQILDHASGYLIALGAQAALIRQMAEGGSWHVQVSLARTGRWLRGLGRVAGGVGGPPADFTGLLETRSSGFGELVALRHAAQLSETPAGWERPAVRPGTHALGWPLG